MVRSYRVELWIRGESDDPDRMPDVSRIVRTRSEERALSAVCLDANVFEERAR